MADAFDPNTVSNSDGSVSYKLRNVSLLQTYRFSTRTSFIPFSEGKDRYPLEVRAGP